MNKRYIGKRKTGVRDTRDWRDDSRRYRHRRYPVTENMHEFSKVMHKRSILSHGEFYFRSAREIDERIGFTISSKDERYIE